MAEDARLIVAVIDLDVSAVSRIHLDSVAEDDGVRGASR